jgi:hypothetical protein
MTDVIVAVPSPGCVAGPIQCFGIPVSVPSPGCVAGPIYTYYAPDDRQKFLTGSGTVRGNAGLYGIQPHPENYR